MSLIFARQSGCGHGSQLLQLFSILSLVGSIEGHTPFAEGAHNLKHPQRAGVSHGHK